MCGYSTLRQRSPSELLLSREKAEVATNTAVSGVLAGQVGAYRGQTFQQLDGQTWQSWVVFVVDVFGKNSNEIVPMGT